MRNESNYIKILKEICSESGYDFTSFADGWLLRIDNGKQHMFIHGYKFPNNNASVSELCTDKSSMSEYLQSVGINNIPHVFFDARDPFDRSYSLALQLMDKYGKLVIKPNDGTGGRRVYKVEDKTLLSSILQKSFEESGVICISPFVDIQSEYRTVIYKDQMLFTFEKKRPTVIADGVTSFNEYRNESKIKDSTFQLDYVPEKGESVLLNWKHNLQGGAKPLLVEPTDEIRNICHKVYSSIGINFASIDVVKVDGEYYVLEINSGVMTECFSRENQEYYRLAKETYRIAINGYFAENR